MGSNKRTAPSPATKDDSLLGAKHPLDRTLAVLTKANKLVERLDDILREIEPPMTRAQVVESLQRTKQRMEGVATIGRRKHPVSKSRTAFLSTETPICELRGALAAWREAAIAEAESAALEPAEEVGQCR